MIVKKSGGQIFGAHLTAAERKAMNLEIQRQLAEYDLKHELEIEALILWTLHDQFGFGPTRLKRFYDRFNSAVKALVSRYELEDTDDIWLCTHKLKEIGVDLENWSKKG